MGYWQSFLDAAGADFHDLARPDSLAQAVVRLLLAAFLGGCIGFQRERDGHEAGIRTHALVVMASALGIWITAAVGIAVGVGRGTTAILWTLLVVVLMELEEPLRRLVDGHRKRPPDGGS